MMDALKFFWNSSEVSTCAKQKIYVACVISILLWGAETWAMTATHTKRLETFHHRSLCIILKISMARVKDKHITNEQVRKMFGKYKQLRQKITYIGHVARKWKAPAAVLTAWIHKCRPKG